MDNENKPEHTPYEGVQKYNDTFFGGSAANGGDIGGGIMAMLGIVLIPCLIFCALIETLLLPIDLILWIWWKIKNRMNKNPTPKAASDE